MKKIPIFAAIFFMLTGLVIQSTYSEDKFMISIFNAETGKVEKVERISKTDAEWKKILTPEQFRITREKGTETPFTGICDIGKSGGIYKCVCCGTDLFKADEKFESGTGWPSFWQPVSELNTKEIPDNSLGMQRIEVNCARCGAHLGHVFDDGPPPTGKRYCINAAALKFVPSAKKTAKYEKAIFAAGCFWGVEEAFRNIKGVVSTSAGYTGGKTKNPTYEDVCSNKTGHAEAVEVEYDPSKITYDELLDIFWKTHDPTTSNQQGPDIGSQYRSGIFYTSEEQKKAALDSREKVEKSGKFKNKIVTQIVQASDFYLAEKYHQKYYMNHGIKFCPR